MKFAFVLLFLAISLNMVEEFEVTNTDKKLHIKAQTLRLYNP